MFQVSCSRRDPAVVSSRNSRAGGTVACAVGLLLISGLLAGCDRSPATTRNNAGTSDAVGESVADPEIRTEYPFSLIPGGVASDAELEAARAADPTLAKHYADVGFLRPAFLGHDQWRYASYREGPSIVWTDARIRVRAGEIVLADRSGNLIRGRCGNRLSDTPQFPVGFIQPPEAFFETPEISFVEPPLLPHTLRDDITFVSFPPFPPIEAPVLNGPIRPVPTTVTGGSEWPTGNPVAPVFVGAPPVLVVPPFSLAPPPPAHAPVVTPEPNSAWLLFSGGIFLGVSVWKLRFRRIPPKNPGRFADKP